MKKLFSALFSIWVLMSSGQADYDSLPYKVMDPGFDAQEIEALITKRRLNFQLEFGTTFGASRYGSYFGTYMAPHFTYPLNPRLSISAGAYLTGISPVFQTENPAFNGYPSGPFYSRSFVYVEGAYRLNQNLTLTGAAYREISPWNTFSPYQGYNPDIQGFIMGVDYRISEHIFIRGEVEVSNGQGPFRNDPWRSPAGGRINDPFFYRP